MRNLVAELQERFGKFFRPNKELNNAEVVEETTIEEKPSVPVKTDEDENLIIQKLMSFYDKQIIKRDFVVDKDDEQSKVALRIIDATIKEFMQTLEKINVQIINTPGVAVGADDDIVDVEKTENPELYGKIASVVRVGYSYNGELKRAQEVIVYKERRN